MRKLVLALCLLASTAQAQIANKVVAFGPFVAGYVSSVPAHLAPNNAITGSTSGSQGSTNNSSADVDVDPLSGGLRKRAGSAIVGDAVSSGLEVSGLLDAKWSAQPRRLFALDSPSLTDGYPTHAVLYTKEANPSFPTVDVGYMGTVYLRSTNGSTNYQLLKEFGGTSYGTSGTDPSTEAKHYLKVVPIWYESGEGGYTRGAFEFARRFICPGARDVLLAGNWLYLPSLRATPSRWNKRYNESNSSVTERNRIFPTGPWGPLYPPRMASLAADSTSGSGGVWNTGDTFYYSVIFQFEDGSYSAPFLPRPPNSKLTGGLGFFTVNSTNVNAPVTTSNLTKYRSLKWANIPLGPDGTVARILLRSPKHRRSNIDSVVVVSPYDLRICGVIRNNTDSTFTDGLGSDAGLLSDDNIVRLDGILPRRARYEGTGDQRAIIGYTLPNTSAIMLAPTGGTNTRDLNVPDDNDNAYPATGFYLRVLPGMVSLYKMATGATSAQQAAAVKNFSFEVLKNLQDLVDAINATTVSDTCGEWAASLAPGVDGYTATTKLCVTVQNVLNCTAANSTTLTTSNSFADLPVGSRIVSNGSTVGFQSYVVSKASNTSLTLSAAATVTADTVTFYSDCGDNRVSADSTRGFIRAFACTYPVVLNLKRSALPGYDRPDKRSVYFTVSSPGAATSGISLAPNAFVAGNRRQPPASSRPESERIMQGIADTEGASVVAYNDGIELFVNRRGQNSGEDFDYRLVTINAHRGCISFRGLVSGNGWVAYPTTDGIVTTDRNLREFLISSSIHNPATGYGELAGEISASAASSASDTDDQFLTCGVMGTKLRVGYRINGLGPQSMTYDFSTAIEASGVEQMVNPRTLETHPWSPPHMHDATAAMAVGPGAFGSVRKSTGRNFYMALPGNNGTGDGRVDQIETGTTDNGTAFIAYAYSPLMTAPSFGWLSPARLEILHSTTVGTSGQNALDTATDQAGTFLDGLHSLTVGTGTFQKDEIKIALSQRGRTAQFWWRWKTSAATTANMLWKVSLQYEELAK